MHRTPKHCYVAHNIRVKLQCRAWFHLRTTWYAYFHFVIACLVANQCDEQQSEERHCDAIYTVLQLRYCCTIQEARMQSPIHIMPSHNISCMYCSASWCWVLSHYICAWLCLVMCVQQLAFLKSRVIQSRWSNRMKTTIHDLFERRSLTPISNIWVYDICLSHGCCVLKRFMALVQVPIIGATRQWKWHRARMQSIPTQWNNMTMRLDLLSLIYHEQSSCSKWTIPFKNWCDDLLENISAVFFCGNF